MVGVDNRVGSRERGTVMIKGCANGVADVSVGHVVSMGKSVFLVEPDAAEFL